MAAENTSTEKVIIIGGGPAGLAAAVYNARASLNPLVIAGSPPGGQLMLTTEVENYPGIESILGPDLIHKMRSHAQKFGTRIVDENVLEVSLDNNPFTVKTSEKVYQTTTILIATGAKAIWLGLDSETRLRGKGVSACATCDGFFFKDKVVAVVGGGDTAMEETLTLTKFASKVYLIHRRDSFRASKIMQDRVKSHPKIEIIYNTTIEEVLGEQVVTSLKLKNVKDAVTSQLTVNGLFLAIGHKPDTDIFAGKIELDEKEYVVTSAVYALRRAVLAHQTRNPHESMYDFSYQYMTSVPGVFAGGDNVDHIYQQAVTAAGMGVAAALEIERWLEVGGGH